MGVPFPWQAGIWQQVQQVQQTGRMPHGIILSGPKGVGKEAFAHYLARFLMCLAPVNGHACQTCKSCLLLEACSHPDVRIFAPEDDGRILKVDQIRDLNEFIVKTPQQGLRKVAILHPAEAMNANAANALLKTLEEPSADAVLILISHATGQLLPTIRSRCQVWSFPLPDRQESTHWLQAKLELQAEEAGYLLQVAQGAPLLAVALAENSALELRSSMLADLAQLLKREASPFEVASRWQKQDLTLILNWLYQWSASLIAYRATGRADRIYDESGRAMLEYVAGKASAEMLYQFLDRIAEAIRELQANQNPNVQLLLESLLSRWLALIARRNRRST